MLDNKSSDSMDDKAFSSIDFVGQCMLDTEKAEAFEKVIKNTVKKNHIALDVGTGSGILAMLAAKAGAKKVVALEFDPFVAKIATENFKNNGYDKVIETVVGDAREHSFDNKETFDVVTMEMLTSGMVDEMQVQAVNNLHRQKAVSPSTVFIPCRQDTYINLANINFSHFGFNMKMILHAWRFFQNIKTADLSGKVLLNSVNFSGLIEESCEVILKLKVDKDGVVNAVWLSSQAFVDKQIFLENTISLNPPVAIPVAERKVSAGEEISLKVKYKFGHGYKNFFAEIL